MLSGGVYIGVIKMVNVWNRGELIEYHQWLPSWRVVWELLKKKLQTRSICWSGSQELFSQL